MIILQKYGSQIERLSPSKKYQGASKQLGLQKHQSPAVTNQDVKPKWKQISDSMRGRNSFSALYLSNKILCNDASLSLLPLSVTYVVNVACETRRLHKMSVTLVMEQLLYASL